MLCELTFISDLPRWVSLVRILCLYPEPLPRASRSNEKEPNSQTVEKYDHKHAKIVLSPQFSASPDDPVNWPTWKRDINLFGVLFSVAVSGILKTSLVTVNGILALNMNVTYNTVSALTGVPLILSAITGVISVVVSRTIGKRIVYLVSAIFMLVGSIYNMHVGLSFAQFVGARALQGIGMGAFNTIPLASIQDMYLGRERDMRTTLYNTVMLGTTWGVPIIGGYMAQSLGGVLHQSMILSIFQAIGFVLLIIGCPETSFCRSTGNVFPLDSGFDRIVPNSSSAGRFSYLKSLHPMPYHEEAKVSLLTRPLRHLGSASTVLLFLMSGLLPAIALAIGNSLPLLQASSYKLVPPFL